MKQHPTLSIKMDGVMDGIVSFVIDVLLAVPLYAVGPPMSGDKARENPTPMSRFFGTTPSDGEVSPRPKK